MSENYDLIFGQSASQQYAWSDSDYQNGWGTVGSTPPTAEQFDALQRKSDTKAKDLNDRLSPIEEKAEADGRQAATTYTAGAMLTVDGLPNGWLLECVVAGISGTDAITLPDTLIDGLTIIDGTVTWALRKVATNGGLGYRQPNETVTAGTIRYHQSLPVGWYLECTTGGTTGSGALVISSPAIGGTVTDGTVVWTVSQNLSVFGGELRGDLSKYDNTSMLLINGGKNGLGASLRLYGGNNTTAPGMFVLRSQTQAGTVADLVGDVNSTLLTWRGYDLGGSAIFAKSLGANGYVKYASGLIVQWGRGVANNDAAGYPSNTFPVSFTTSYKIVAMGSNVTDATINIIATSSSTNSKPYLKTNYPGGVTVDYIAIGY